MLQLGALNGAHSLSSPHAMTVSDGIIPLNCICVNHLCTENRQCTAFDASVAADANDYFNVITSPTESWVPEFPIIAHREITTYADGWWGPQEYTRWPQMFNESVFHHVCIPLKGSYSAPSNSVYEAFPSDFFVESTGETYECETPGFGRMKEDMLKELQGQVTTAMEKLKAAERMARFVHSERDRSRSRPKGADAELDGRLGAGLRILLRNAVDRLTYMPCTQTHILVTGRMAHRLILEMYGLSIYYSVIVDRLHNPNPTNKYPPMFVRGAFVRNAATAQQLHHLGIPFWFLQRYRPDIVIKKVVRPTPWTGTLSGDPLGMKVPKAWYDPGGTSQDPARWVHPSLLYVCSRLCAASLPRLEDVVVPDVPDVKRHKGPSGSSTTRANVEGTGSSKKKTRRGGQKHTTNARPSHPAFSYQPPPGDILSDTPNWRYALQVVSPLPNPPSRAAVYYFPPPFIFISAGDKLGRFIHNYARIRMFCRQRLLEPHFDGRPLKISEWKHALHGDYSIDNESLLEATGQPVVDAKASLRHEHKQAIRKLFAKSAGLTSYSEDMTPKFRRDRITAAQAASDRALAREVIWEVNEMNWRCELRALDSLVVDADRSEWLRWEREQAVCEVWRETKAESAHSSLFCTQRSRFCWTPVGANGWRERMYNLVAFIRVLSRWPNFPSELRDRLHALGDQTDAEEFARSEKVAVAFYVSTFAQHYGRLPCIPLRRVDITPIASTSEVTVS